MMLKYAPMFLVPMTAFLACTQTLPDSSTAPSTQAAPLPTCQDLQHTLMTMECKEGQETCYVPHRSDFPQAVLTCGHGLLVYKQRLCRDFPDQATPELLAHVTCDYASVITSAATSAPAPDPHPNAPKINPMAEAHLRPLCESIQGRLQDAFCMVALTNVRLVVLHKEKIHSLGCGSAQPCLSPITSYVVVYEKATRQVAEIPNVQGRWVYDLFASTGARTPPLSLSKLLSEVPHKTITLTPAQALPIDASMNHLEACIHIHTLLSMGGQNLRSADQLLYIPTQDTHSALVTDKGVIGLNQNLAMCLPEGIRTPLLNIQFGI